MSRDLSGKDSSALTLRDVAIGYNGNVVLKDLNFSVRRGEIFAIMGASGCGKSTLLKHIIGIHPLIQGSISIFGRELPQNNPLPPEEIAATFGVTYQGGALLGSLSLIENVALVLEEHTDWKREKIYRVAKEKLAMVGLENFTDYLPSEISGGMKKRAGLARALALDPPLLFFDEPSAGLDPVSSAALDKLIMKLRSGNRTVVIVTHELDSVFAIADRIVMLDKNTRTIAACGDPRQLKNDCPVPWVKDFLNRCGMIYQSTSAAERNKNHAE